MFRAVNEVKEIKQLETFSRRAPRTFDYWAGNGKIHQILIKSSRVPEVKSISWNFSPESLKPTKAEKGFRFRQNSSKIMQSNARSLMSRRAVL